MHLSNKSRAAATIATAIMLAFSQVAEARDDGGLGMAPYLRQGPAALSPASWTITRVRAFEPVSMVPLARLASAPEPAETPPAAVPVPAGKQFGTFASVAISAGKLPAAKKWRTVTGADYAALFTDGCEDAGFSACESMLATRLRKARQHAQGLSGPALLEAVNTTVNAALAYGTDRANWGQGDYWATPAETVARGIGDCEDFAITKMWLLRSLGVPGDELQLVVLQDTRKAVYHAVLAVHLDGRRYILDNLSARVRTDDAFPSYMPIMSFVGDKSYIHGFERKRTDFAGMPKDLGAVSPGEGV